MDSARRNASGGHPPSDILKTRPRLGLGLRHTAARAIPRSAGGRYGAPSNATHVQAPRPIESAAERKGARRAVRSAEEGVRAAAADAFAVAYQSECRPGGPYGAL